MSVRLRLLGLAATAALALSACASGSSSTTPEAPTPTVVPPALAFVDAVETVDPGLWNEVAINDDLAMCLAHASGSDAGTIDVLRGDLEDMGIDGEAIIADCLPGA